MFSPVFVTPRGPARPPHSRTKSLSFPGVTAHRNRRPYQDIAERDVTWWIAKHTHLSGTGTTSSRYSSRIRLVLGELTMTLGYYSYTDRGVQIRLPARPRHARHTIPVPTEATTH